MESICSGASKVVFDDFYWHFTPVPFPVNPIMPVVQVGVVLMSDSLTSRHLGDPSGLNPVRNWSGTVASNGHGDQFLQIKFPSGVIPVAYWREEHSCLEFKFLST